MFLDRIHWVLGDLSRPGIFCRKPSALRNPRPKCSAAGSISWPSIQRWLILLWAMADCDCWHFLHVAWLLASRRSISGSQHFWMVKPHTMLRCIFWEDKPWQNSGFPGRLYNGNATQWSNPVNVVKQRRSHFPWWFPWIFQGPWGRLSCAPSFWKKPNQSIYFTKVAEGRHSVT